MALDPGRLPQALQAFLSERHLGSLTTVQADGRIHVVPVGFTYDRDARIVRIITSRGSQKVRNVAATGRAAVCSVDGPRWVSFEGKASVHDDEASVAAAVARYTTRYKRPRANPDRVALHLAVERVLGRA